MSRFKAYRTVSNRYHPTLKVCNGGVRDLEVEQVDIISHKITLKNALYLSKTELHEYALVGNTGSVNVE